MNDDLVDQRLRELAWRRELTDVEQAQLRAWLAAHPDRRADWESESVLNGLLARLPDSPVPSNFTARVLQAVDCESARADRERVVRRLPRWRMLVPRFALGLAFIAAGWLAYHQHTQTQRLKLAESVAAVAEVRSLPSPKFLEDFDAIYQLPPMPTADDELLALMK